MEAINQLKFEYNDLIGKNIPEMRPKCRGFNIAGQISLRKINAETARVRTN